MEMFLCSFGRARNENHTDFFFSFSYLPLICCVGDSDTAAAEGDLAALKMLVLFQWFSGDEKMLKTAVVEPSLTIRFCAKGLSILSSSVLHTFSSEVLVFLPCCFSLIFFSSHSPTLFVCSKGLFVHTLIFPIFCPPKPSEKIGVVCIFHLTSVKTKHRRHNI